MATKDRVERIITSLIRARKENPQMAALLSLQEELIKAQSIIEIGDLPLKMNAENIWENRWLVGAPAMFWEDLGIDWDSFHYLIKEAVKIITRHMPAASQRMAALSYQERDSGQSLVESWFVGEALDSVTAGVIAVAAQPWLWRAADMIGPYLDPSLWRRGTCPVCGGLPDIAILEERVGARSLCCSRCDTHWEYARLGCPFCGNNDPKTLFYYTDDSGLYRLYVCKTCHNYLKTIDQRQANRSIEPAVERIILLPLDQQGYTLAEG